uniref:Transposase n=1 Tax=Steinernema glaseri TaxID=37863 RepID=A0A1I7XXK4_9BILA
MSPSWSHFLSPKRRCLTPNATDLSSLISQVFTHAKNKFRAFFGDHRRTVITDSGSCLAEARPAAALGIQRTWHWENKRGYGVPEAGGVQVEVTRASRIAAGKVGRTPDWEPGRTWGRTVISRAVGVDV